MKKFPQRTRDPCRRSEPTMKAASNLASRKIYCLLLAVNVRRICRTDDERRYENLADATFVFLSMNEGHEYTDCKRKVFSIFITDI